jgi:hypothetical protein
MKISLRAYGLKSFLETPRTFDDILAITSDSPKAITEVIRELQKKKFLTSFEEKGRVFFICAEPKPDNIADQERRIENLFYKIRPYYIIAWWFAEEGKFYTTDEELKSAVECEYEHARTIQFFDDKFLKMGYEEYKKTVSHNRTLSGLFQYATKARGY